MKKFTLVLFLVFSAAIFADTDSNTTTPVKKASWAKKNQKSKGPTCNSQNPSGSCGGNTGSLTNKLLTASSSK